MDQEKVGKFIAKLRKEKNITQSQLADKLGTNVKTISRWETGATLFDISYLKQLCDIFEINELELLKGERLKELEDIKNQKKTKDAPLLWKIFLLFLGNTSPRTNRFPSTAIAVGRCFFTTPAPA